MASLGNTGQLNQYRNIGDCIAVTNDPLDPPTTSSRLLRSPYETQNDHYLDYAIKKLVGVTAVLGAAMSLAQIGMSPSIEQLSVQDYIQIVFTAIHLISS